MGWHLLQDKLLFLSLFYVFTLRGGWIASLGRGRKVSAAGKRESPIKMEHI
jgi:hypothetical protein